MLLLARLRRNWFSRISFVLRSSISWMRSSFCWFILDSRSLMAASRSLCSLLSMSFSRWSSAKEERMKRSHGTSTNYS